MKDYYVYIHLNPSNNEIFYVGKGKGRRKTSKSSRNEKWVKYVSNLTEAFKVIVLKNNLSEREAFDLETRVLSKVDWHYEDETTNILDSEPNVNNGTFVQICFGKSINTENNQEINTRFKNSTDEEIIKTLLEFPNQKIMQEIQRDFDLIFDFFHDNYDDLEEIDQDVFIGIESILDSINDLIERYEVADKENIGEFVVDLKGERFDVELLLNESPKGLQEIAIRKMLNWIDSNLKVG
ncbi:MAG: hypothetical protein P8I82_02100 [Flavobacteriales bacterium]|nr:hypothetical protein [Flavobacteriales bacterium]